MLLLSAVFALVMTSAMMGQTLVTTRPGTANNTGTLTYWCSQVGPPGTYIGGGFGASATTLSWPVPVTINWGPANFFQISIESFVYNGTYNFEGDFLQNDCLAILNNPLTITATFSQPVSHFGFQIEAAQLFVYPVTITAIPCTGPHIQFTYTLPINGLRQDGSAQYLGVDMGASGPLCEVDYAINSNDVWAINEPSVTVPDDPMCYSPPNTTMVAWYPFDEPEGSPGILTSANLASANFGTQHVGYHYHVVNNVSYAIPNHPLGGTAGIVAGAASFNGTNQYVESPSTIATNFGPAGTTTTCTGPSYSGSGGYSSCLGNFSIDTWVNVPATAPSDVMAIVDKRSDSPLLGYHFFVYNSPNGTQQYVGLQLADPSGYANYLSLPLKLYDGTWHHIAVTVNRTAPNGIIFYHNGGPVGNGTAGQPGSLVNSSPLRIGTRTASSPLTGWFLGSLDELEIYNRDLTAAEVQGIYNAGSHGKCK